MITPTNLSTSELKRFHKATREKIECAIDSPPPSLSKNPYGFISIQLIIRRSRSFTYA